MVASCALLLGGCHWIFPFGQVAGDGPTAPEAGRLDGKGPTDTAADTQPAADVLFDLGPIDAATIGNELVPAWAVHFTGVDADEVTGVAVDSAGDLYVTGFFMGQLVIGSTICCSTATNTDAFLAKLSSSGNQIWVELPGDAGSSVAEEVLIDRNGNLRLVGNFSKSIMFGTTKLNEYNPTVPQRDSFLATYKPAQPPQVLSALAFTGPGYDYVDHIAQDAKGNLYLAGSFAQELSLAGTTLSQVAGSTEIVVASLDENGAHRWSKAFGSPSMDAGMGVAVDGAGNVYLVGDVYASVTTVDFGGGPRPTIGEWDAFVASFDENGVHRWSRVIGGPTSDRGWGVAVDADGNVYLTGYATGPVDFGDGQPQASQGIDAFLVSYTSNGSHRWSKLLGGAQSDQGVALAARTNGTVALAGDFAGTIDLGGGPLVSVDGGDTFVAVFDAATGTHRWSTSFGGASDSHAADLATDGGGNLYLAGYFEGELVLGGGPLVCPDGFSDGFVLKLVPK